MHPGYRNNVKTRSDMHPGYRNSFKTRRKMHPGYRNNLKKDRNMHPGYRNSFKTRGQAAGRSGGRAANFITCKFSLRSVFEFFVQFPQIQTYFKKNLALGSASSILTTVSQKAVVESRPISRKRSERSRMAAESSNSRSKLAYRVSSVTPCEAVRETGVSR